jgi:hypothetical protein
VVGAEAVGNTPRDDRGYEPYSAKLVEGAFSESHSKRQDCGPYLRAPVLCRPEGSVIVGTDGFGVEECSAATVAHGGVQAIGLLGKRLQP